MTERHRRIATALKSRLRSLLQRSVGAFGVELHREAERRDYWEDRGARYQEEVSSILDPADPYWQAQQVFLEELTALEWSSILEVGCGFGWHLKAISQRFEGRCIAGIDFSYSQLRRASSYLDSEYVDLCRASALGLPFSDCSFDVVFTSGLLMCIHPGDLDGAISELERVSRSEVIVMEVGAEHLVSDDKKTVAASAAWHAHEYADAFERAGLKMVAADMFASFRSHPERVPLSFFHGVKK